MSLLLSPEQMKEIEAIFTNAWDTLDRNYEIEPVTMRQAMAFCDAGRRAYFARDPKDGAEILRALAKVLVKRRVQKAAPPKVIDFAARRAEMLARREAAQKAAL